MSASVEAHFFRHEYGRLVAVLVRHVGVQHLVAIEDAAQEALVAAVESWPRTGKPDVPAAWLYRVARNQLAGSLRQGRRHAELALEHLLRLETKSGVPAGLLAGEVPDDLLRMLFTCCHESIPIESQLVLALKTLCGFDVREIAHRLFMTEANAYKRLARARTTLREVNEFGEMTAEQLAERLPAVQLILYTLFTEGYLSSHAEVAIRRELCDEAVRLTTLLAEHPLGSTAPTCALLALMHLHSARLSGRQDDSGGLLLLEEQDRSQWDRNQIAVGLSWLARAADGEVFTRYHAEAGIALEHCLSPSLEATRWDRIVECYELLERTAPSPLHTLNRAVAMAAWRGPLSGIAVLEGFAPPSWLTGSYQWSAVLSDLHQRAGHVELAARHREVAIATAPTDAIRATLTRRFKE